MTCTSASVARAQRVSSSAWSVTTMTSAGGRVCTASEATAAVSCSRRAGVQAHRTTDTVTGVTSALDIAEADGLLDGVARECLHAHDRQPLEAVLGVRNRLGAQLLLEAAQRLRFARLTEVVVVATGGARVLDG